MTARQRVALAVILCLGAGLRAGAQEPIPGIEQWLRGPDRREFAWKVRILRPQLTFQQRHLLQVRADVMAHALPDVTAQRNLQFEVRIADARGQWIRSGYHTQLAVPPNLDSQAEIQFTTGMYLRAGTYTVAVVAFDTASGRGNLWRKTVKISPPEHDPLPQLDRDLPVVEFLPDVPPDSVPERTWTMNDNAWSLSEGREWLAVRNSRPVRVDVVLNLSGTASAVANRQRFGRLLQMGSVLSHLQLARGCVRVSTVDLHRLRVIADRAEAAGFDWFKAREALFSADQNLVDLSTLAQQKGTALFFRRFLSDLLYHTPGCSEDEPVHRVVVIAGASHLFPEGTTLFGVWPEMPCDCEFYYLRADAAPYDDIGSMLKRVKRRQFNLTTTQEFRRAVARLIADLEKPLPPPRAPWTAPKS